MTIVIGICGNSCSGKSTICKELINKYPSDITYLKADKFFKTKNTNFVNNQPIWNSPVDVAFDKLIEAVSNLKEGHIGFMPNKTFTEKYDKELKPNKIILIEGFLIYTNKELVSLFDKKIFLNIDNDELISRRLERNVNEDIDFIQKAVIEPAKESIDLYWTKIKHNDIIDDVKNLLISHLDCKERLIYHIEPVVNNAIFLANQLNANSQIVEIASYLHDITRMTGDRENHHISGSELSRNFLTSLNYPLAKTNLICDCILNHRGSKRLTRKTIEENIVASADAMAIIGFPVPLFHAAYNKRQLNMDDGKKFIRDKLTRSWNKIELNVAKETVRIQYESLMEILK